MVFDVSLPILAGSPYYTQLIIDFETVLTWVRLKAATSLNLEFRAIGFFGLPARNSSTLSNHLN